MVAQSDCITPANSLGHVVQEWQHIWHTLSATNKIVFYIHDCLPLSPAQPATISDFSMAHHPCLCCRLRRKSTQNNCPIFFQILDRQYAQDFIKNKAAIANGTLYNKHQDL